MSHAAKTADTAPFDDLTPGDVERLRGALDEAVQRTSVAAVARCIGLSRSAVTSAIARRAHVATWMVIAARVHRLPTSAER